VERVAREIHILKMIRHPNIIQLYEIIETSQQLYLIMEYASGGELFSYIVKQSRLKEKEACEYFQQIIAGVEYFHKLNVVHRDLKPENLLFDHNRHIKIVDFGLSNTYQTGDTLVTACGSPCYAAPEMIAGKRYVGLRVDIWSCGVVLFAMVCGYLPFEDPNTSQLYRKILNCSYKAPKGISAEAKDLIKHILNKDPEQRYTIEQIRGHPWFTQVTQALSPGVLVGYDKVPIDFNILYKLKDFGFSVQRGQESLEGNKHNLETTTYFLMLKKHLASGGASVADVAASGFAPMQFAPRPPSRLFGGFKGKTEDSRVVGRGRYK
jgi:5'-AMP-activated protein kinase catalytic alpha subunit